MMRFEEWLQKKQKMGKDWFMTMIEDKKPYYEAYDEYRCRAARFEALAAREDCARVAKELVALG